MCKVRDTHSAMVHIAAMQHMYAGIGLPFYCFTYVVTMSNYVFFIAFTIKCSLDIYK